MTAQRPIAPRRRLAVRIAALAGLLLAGASLGGCVIVAPPHHYGRGYY